MKKNITSIVSRHFHRDTPVHGIKNNLNDVSNWQTKWLNLMTDFIMWLFRDCELSYINRHRITGSIGMFDFANSVYKYTLNHQYSATKFSLQYQILLSNFPKVYSKIVIVHPSVLKLLLD